MNSSAIADRHWSNKVPAVTLLFWAVKMISTTVGETAADYLNVDLKLGLIGTTAVTGVLLTLALAWQVCASRYIAVRYWAVVALVSVFGTLVTDNLSDNLGVDVAVSSGVFALLLAGTFTWWYRDQKTLSIHSIDSPRREFFYWLAIFLTFALGTAAGDWLAEDLKLGYALAAGVFALLIAAVALAHDQFRLNAIATFWIAYVLTRPLGASCGDLLSQPIASGGLGVGPTMTTAIFVVLIVVAVAYLSTQSTSQSNADHS